MNQLALSFEPVRARRTDPQTSQRSATRARQFTAGHFALILDALALGAANFKEIAERCGLERHAVARRLPELEQAGRVKRTDVERDNCTVWRLAP